MTEYKIEFKESELSSRVIPKNVMHALGARGRVVEVQMDTKYYFATSENIDGLLDLISGYKGVRIARLQGNLLKS
jgi:hypothetical protein